MLISALIIFIGISVFFQSDINRFYIALTYFLSIAVHDIFFHSQTGFAYYGSAALFDLLAIIVISRIRPITKTSIAISNISLFSILLNFTGWLIWLLYWPPLTYNVAFIAVYTSAIIALNKKDSMRSGDNARFSAINRWNYLFYYHTVARLLYRNRPDPKL